MADDDAALVEQLQALHRAAEYSAGARDDFWDLVASRISRIVELAALGARKAGRRGAKAAAGVNGGRARAAALSPERRREIASRAANARWGAERC